MNLFVLRSVQTVLLSHEMLTGHEGKWSVFHRVVMWLLYFSIPVRNNARAADKDTFVCLFRKTDAAMPVFDKKT